MTESVEKEFNATSAVDGATLPGTVQRATVKASPRTSLTKAQAKVTLQKRTEEKGPAAEDLRRASPKAQAIKAFATTVAREKERERERERERESE